MSISQEIQAYLTRINQLKLDKADKADDLTVTIQLNLLGDDGGSYGLRIHNGQIDTGAGYVKSPDLIFSIAAEDYLAVTRGEVDPIKLVMSGQATVEGDRTLAMRIVGILQNK